MNPGKFIARFSALSLATILRDNIGFVLLLWLARTDQTGFGLLVFGTGLAVLVLAVLDQGLDQYTLREFSRSDRPPHDLLLGLTRLKLALGLALTGGAIGVLALKGWEWTSLVLILGVLAARVVDSCSETFLSVFRARGRQVWEAGITIGSLLAGAGYGALLLYWGNGPSAVVRFLVVTAGLRLVAVLIVGRTSGLLPGIPLLRPLSASRSWLKRHSRGLLAFSGVFILGAFFNRIQPLLLKQFHDLDQVALFGVAYDLTGGVMAIISTLAIGRVIFPDLVRTMGSAPDDFKEMARSHVRGLALIGLGLGFFIYTGGDLLLELIYGPKYSAALIPVRILSFSIPLSLANNFLISVFLAEGRYRILLGTLALGALSSLVCGLPLIQARGAQGAALNLLISRGLIALVFLIVGHRRYGLVSGGSLVKALPGLLILGGVYPALALWSRGGATLTALGLFALWLWSAYIRKDLRRGA